MRIGKMAKAAGISEYTLRYYGEERADPGKAG